MYTPMVKTIWMYVCMYARETAYHRQILTDITQVLPTIDQISTEDCKKRTSFSKGHVEN